MSGGDCLKFNSPHRLLKLLRYKPEEAAAVGGRECESLLQVGEIERRRIGQRFPIRQIQTFLQNEIG
jgi:hypothetical protein